MKKFNYLIIFLCYMLVSSGCSINNDDDDDNQKETGSTITDKDGNVYKTVIIGTQTWMAENLRTTHYSNGDPIFEFTQSNSSEIIQKGAYSNIGFNENYVNPYGRIYNYRAIKDSRKICPDGWHVPSIEEWEILFEYLTSMGYGVDGSGGDIAKALASTTTWTSSSVIGSPGNDPTTNNSSGFNAFPATSIGRYTWWWTISEYTFAHETWVRSPSIKNNNPTPFTTAQHADVYNNNEFDVCRCLKD